MATRVKQDGGDDEATVDLISSTLPRDDRWMPLCLSGGFWLLDLWVPAMPAAQRRLITRPDDVFVASCPKSGTTWLKALVFAVVHRHLHRPSDPHHPLRTASPHDCVPFLEEELLITAAAGDLEYYALPSSPRIWSIHSPYSSLPAASVRDSDCRIVYIARDPKDVFTSLFHFKSEVEYSAGTGPLAVDEAFEMFCSGICPYGPIWEHALEYWNESLRRPEKVMFLRYEEMKRDPAGNLRRLAEFLGRPFSSEEEEREGVAVRDEILELCSFRSLTGLAVNREGVLEKYKSIAVPRKSFFRVGAVGDWRNCLSEEMAARLDRITEEKLQGSGLKLS